VIADNWELIVEAAGSNYQLSEFFEKDSFTGAANHF